MFFVALSVTLIWIVVRLFFTNAEGAVAKPTPNSRVIDHPVDHAIVLSIDGLRPDALESAVHRGLPGFARLLDGPHTLDARTDPDCTVTLPNHVGMVTGRTLKGPQGHHWLPNAVPPTIAEGGTLHAAAGEYVPSMWDVAHDRGVRTAMVASKPKFILFDNSYRAEQAQPDAEGPDDGREKLDVVWIALDAAGAEQKAKAFLDESAAMDQRSLAFVHWADPDASGHGRTWDVTDGSAYMACIDSMDALVDDLLRHIDQSPALRGRTAIVLTADHGGGAPPASHTLVDSPLNFRIPFVVWVGGGGERGDLYDLSPNRTRPAVDARVSESGGAPIRNADAGNCALWLMGLPSIPTSTAGVEHDLLSRWSSRER